jgi:hypothetical protein
MRVGRISKSINDGYFQLKKNGKKNKITEKKFWKLLGGRVGQNCNYVDPDGTNYLNKTVLAGTIVYNGMRQIHENFRDKHSCPPHFQYTGISNGYDGKGIPLKLYVKGYPTNVLYTSTLHKTGEGYTGGNGWIRHYRVKHDIDLPNITTGFTHIEPYELEPDGACFTGDCHGYYLNWGSGDEEIVFCNPSKHLEYLGAQKNFLNEDLEKDLSCTDSEDWNLHNEIVEKWREKQARIYFELDKKKKGKKVWKPPGVYKRPKDLVGRVDGGSKKVRKHRGIIQSGINKGKLKKGYRYSGKKLKSGLPQIVSAKK